MATFGVGNEHVHDELYRKAGKLNTEHFSVGFDPLSSGLLEVIQTELMEKDRDSPSIRADRYKLNVYGESLGRVAIFYHNRRYLPPRRVQGPGSFFKAHQDTPRGIDMFGSLVIVYPTPHDGGELVLRHEGKAWTFDSAKITAEERGPSLAYIAFYSDVEHEVLEVRSGYRVTVTYNLYFTARETFSSIHPRTFGPDLKAALQRALDDPSFLPDGGHLGFGLSHRYPIHLERRISEDIGRQLLGELELRLKGGDAVVMKVCTELNLKTFLRFLVEDTDMIIRKDGKTKEYIAYVMMDRFVDTHDHLVEEPMRYHLRYMGGQLITPIPPRERSDSLGKPDVLVRWIVPPKRDHQLKSQFVTYGNEPGSGFEYAHFSLIIAVGKFGERQLGEGQEDYDDTEFTEVFGDNPGDRYH